MAKDVVKHYRLTTDDAAAFRKKAEEAGMTESDYFRLLITQQPSDYPEIRGGIKSTGSELTSMRLCLIITLIYIVLRIRKDSLPICGV